MIIYILRHYQKKGNRLYSYKTQGININRLRNVVSINSRVYDKSFKEQIKNENRN